MLRQQRLSAAETASLRKRAVTPPLAFRSDGKFGLRESANLAIAPRGICTAPLRFIRNALAACSVQNNVPWVGRTSDIQDEAVGVRCYPSQVARIVVAKTDHFRLPLHLDPHTLDIKARWEL